jgi:predicted glycosyltransferase
VSPKPFKIWIDLDNSPHVPFFKPIIHQLQLQGFALLVTARDRFQVCSLADLLGIKYQAIGRDFTTKNKYVKIFGLALRVLQLLPTVRRQRPDLAVSHGSRSMMAVTRLLRIPLVMVCDYEHATAVLRLCKPAIFMVPEVIPNEAIDYPAEKIRNFPGIKEDVYVPGFRPDPSIVAQLGIPEGQIVCTVRPPATEAHYQSPRSVELFVATMKWLHAHANVTVVLLPRTTAQEEWMRTQWPAWFEDGRIIIPAAAVDGLNLLHHSDLAISGGGTMNREAAALGVPVYSIFKGKIGAVDRYLADKGRLFLIDCEADLETVRLVARPKTPPAPQAHSPALEKIVDCIFEYAAQLQPAKVQPAKVRPASAAS